MFSSGQAGPPQGLAASRVRLTAQWSGPVAAHCASERRTAPRRVLVTRGRGTTRRDVGGGREGWAEPAERSAGTPAAGPSRLPAGRQTGGGAVAPRMRTTGGRLGGVLSPGGAPVGLRGSCWRPGGGFRAPFPTRPGLRRRAWTVPHHGPMDPVQVVRASPPGTCPSRRGGRSRGRAPDHRHRTAGTKTGPSSRGCLARGRHGG